MGVSGTELHQNEELEQFELTFNEGTALIAYEKSGNVYNLLHTEVPEALEGRGIASDLVEKALSYIKNRDSKIIPSCSYVRAYLKKHPEWEALVSY